MRNGQARTKRTTKSYVEFRDQHGCTLTTQELTVLFATTWDGPVRFGMTGPERSMLYRLANETGLELQELRRLTPASFRLGESPAVIIAIGHGVRYGEQALPLRPETAEDLGSFLIVPEPDQPIFRIPDELAEMLRADIHAAKEGVNCLGDAPKAVADCHHRARGQQACGHD